MNLKPHQPPRKTPNSRSKLTPAWKKLAREELELGKEEEAVLKLRDKGLHWIVIPRYKLFKKGTPECHCRFKVKVVHRQVEKLLVDLGFQFVTWDANTGAAVFERLIWAKKGIVRDSRFQPDERYKEVVLRVEWGYWESSKEGNQRHFKYTIDGVKPGKMLREFLLMIVRIRKEGGKD